MTRPSSWGYAIYALSRSVQGRFKSLIVEPSRHLCDLVDYVHLNPARANLVEPAKIGSCRWSSLY